MTDVRVHFPFPNLRDSVLLSFYGVREVLCNHVQYGCMKWDGLLEFAPLVLAIGVYYVAEFDLFLLSDIDGEAPFVKRRAERDGAFCRINSPSVFLL